MSLHLELQRHAELVGAVVAVAMEYLCLFLFDLLDLVIVLERLDLVERLLEPVLHSAGAPWMAVRLRHYLDGSECH